MDLLTALTLDQLRILVAVSETGSFSAAGRKLQRVQSAISQAIQTLEQTQGVLLFDRSAKTPVLTEAGRVLTERARCVLRQADIFESTASAIISGLEPELTLAVDSLLPTKPLVESLRALKNTFPDLQVTLFTEGFGAAERRVRDDSATLAFCVLSPTSAQDLQAYPLMKVALVPVVAASHPLASAGQPVTRDLLQEYVQLVLTDPINPGGPSYSVVSSRIWRFVEMGLRFEFLLAGFGWANMPSHLAAPALASGELVDLGIRDPCLTPEPIPVYAAYKRGSPPRQAARWLLTDLQNRLASANC